MMKLLLMFFAVIYLTNCTTQEVERHTVQKVINEAKIQKSETSTVEKKPPSEPIDMDERLKNRISRIEAQFIKANPKLALTAEQKSKLFAIFQLQLLGNQKAMELESDAAQKRQKATIDVTFQERISELFTSEQLGVFKTLIKGQDVMEPQTASFDRNSSANIDHLEARFIEVDPKLALSAEQKSELNIIFKTQMEGFMKIMKIEDEEEKKVQKIKIGTAVRERMREVLTPKQFDIFKTPPN